MIDAHIQNAISSNQEGEVLEAALGQVNTVEGHSNDFLLNRTPI
jgi:hypothetical protein